MNTLFGILSGAFTALLIVLFSGIVAYAWSGARRESFEASARLALEEDPGCTAPGNPERQP